MYVNIIHFIIWIEVLVRKSIYFAPLRSLFANIKVLAIEQSS